MTKWRLLLLWLLVVSLAIGLRFWQLGSIPWGTYWDETAILVDAKALAQTGHDIHGLPFWQTIFPSYGDYKLPVYIWFATASVKLFGATAWALRLPSAIIGVLGVILAGALIRELWRDLKPAWQREVGALIAGFVMAVSPWDVLFSRTAFEGHLGQFFLGLSIYTWLIGRRRPVWRWVSAALGAWATYCYYSVRFVWPAVIGILTLAELWVLWAPTFRLLWESQWRQIKISWSLVRKTAWQSLLLGLIPLVLFGLFLVPLLKSPFAKDADTFRLSADSILNMADWPVVSNQYREMAGNHPWDRLFYHRNWLIARELLNNYADHLNLKYLFITGDTNLRHGTTKTGVFLWWALPGLLFGLYLWAKRYPRWFVVLLVWWLAALLPASVPETTPHALRSLNALLPAVLLISGGLTWLVAEYWHWQLQQKTLMKRVSWGLVAILGMSIVTSIGVFADDYFNFYPARSANNWQSGYSQLAQQIIRVNSIQAETWIYTGDDKFFLWMILQMDIVHHQPGPWLEAGYLFYQLGPYHVSNRVDWAAVANNQKPMLVVMQQKALEEELKSHQLIPTWSVTSEPIANLPLYQISAFNWPAH